MKLYLFGRESVIGRQKEKGRCSLSWSRRSEL